MKEVQKIDDALLAAAFRSSCDGIAIVTPAGDVLYMNDAMVALFGCAREELTTIHDWIKNDFKDKETVKEVLRLWDEDIKSDNPPERRFQVAAKDGSKSWRRMHITLMPGGNVVINANDITEHVAAETALRMSEQLSRSVVHSNPMGMMMYEYSDDGALVFSGYNPAADEILGIENSQFMGKTIEEAFPALIETEVPQQYRRVASEGGTWHSQQIDYEHDNVSGAYEVFAFQTGPNRMAVSFFDITKRKQVEYELSRLAAAVASAAESIIITNAKGIIRYVNPCFERMTGFTSEEVLGQYAKMLASDQTDAETSKHLWDTISSGKVWVGMFKNKKKDGSVFEEEAVISPIKDDKGEIISYVAVKRDVSRERMLESQVRQSQKMAAIGQLAHTITHSFSNTLTMILGNARLAKDGLEESSDLHEYLDQVMEAVRRISTLTGELLAFAHPAPLVLRPMRVDKVLTGINDIISGTVAKRVTFSVEIEKGIGKVNVDVAQLEQAIMHIVINADDAMADGGELFIDVAKSKLSSVEVSRLQGSLPEGKRHRGDFAVISIRDNGSGMDSDTCSRIFDPFFTTKATRKNPGLGLSTVFTIISQHNGHILVESESGKGSIFRIYLPIIDDEDLLPSSLTS